MFVTHWCIVKSIWYVLIIKIINQYFLYYFQQSFNHRARPESRGPDQASFPSLYVQHEDDQLQGSRLHHGRDPTCPGGQLCWFWAAGTLLVVLRPRWRTRGQPDSVGDGGVQTAAAVAQRCPLQTYLWFIHGLQKHCLQNLKWTVLVNSQLHFFFFLGLVFIFPFSVYKTRISWSNLRQHFDKLYESVRAFLKKNLTIWRLLLL